MAGGNPREKQTPISTDAILHVSFVLLVFGSFVFLQNALILNALWPIACGLAFPHSRLAPARAVAHRHHKN